MIEFCACVVFIGDQSALLCTFIYDSVYIMGKENYGNLTTELLALLVLQRKRGLIFSISSKAVAFCEADFTISYLDSLRRILPMASCSP